MPSANTTYLLLATLVMFAVTYALRGTVFAVFGGSRTPPKLILYIGRVIGPAVIASLVVYCFRNTNPLIWPYGLPEAAATLVCILLHLWKRNPLVSIVAGPAVYMLLLNCCGCATRHVYRLDASNPELRMTDSGVYLGDERVEPGDVVDALEDAEVPKDHAIHIRMDSDMKDLRAPRLLMVILAKGGYKRSVLVTDQHGESMNKSGMRYAGADVGRSDDIVMFTVFEEEVRFGWLTPVGPNEVVQCLESQKIGKDHLIRLYGQAKDFDSPKVKGVMKNLEEILRKGGYGNVKRYWIETPKTAQPANVKGVRGNPEALIHPAAPAARTKNGIRYKRSDE